MIDSILLALFVDSGYKSVQPIFAAKCAQCHNSNTPTMNWMDEKVAMASKSRILHRLRIKSMPPNYISTLTDAERAALIGWASQ